MGWWSVLWVCCCSVMVVFLVFLGCKVSWFMWYYEFIILYGYLCNGVLLELFWIIISWDDEKKEYVFVCWVYIFECLFFVILFLMILIFEKLFDKIVGCMRVVYVVWNFFFFVR